ncbi:ornithine decarboxylase 1-like [Aricia agestis]|uniref:ornithine decarboxylase 1-like n=1 Tax=Aricia agestis TaxID=91739 RepID=UPI001C206F6C|nr:ornithine decarboxylase 1-like [Aricia agestis]
MRIVEEQHRLSVVEGPWEPNAAAREAVAAGAQEDPFYIMDLGEVVARYRRWTDLMPRIEPFYAVKCNDDPVLVAALAALGAGFDCASRAEIQLVTDLGVAPERIIFANPAKMASHMRHAAAVGVRAVTFDSESELLKIKQYMPEARLVLRIRCDAAAAQCPLGIKFGCDPVEEAPRLLKLAAVLDLDVAGVAFHVGSGAGETAAYARGVRLARALFELGAALGLRLRLLDVGGGFPGHASSSVADVAGVLNAALEQYFPGRDVRVIAEPGRYFAAAAYTLAAAVHATREVRGPAGEPHTMYFINDGVYGSFNCVLYDHAAVRCEPLTAGGEARACSVWGPSCDGLDCVLPAAALPPLAAGDWLVFPDMGAYTIPIASPFNGFPVPTVRHFIDAGLWEELRERMPLSAAQLAVVRRAPPASPAPSPPASPPPAPPSPPPVRRVFVECALK